MYRCEDATNRVGGQIVLPAMHPVHERPEQRNSVCAVPSRGESRPIKALAHWR